MTIVRGNIGIGLGRGKAKGAFNYTQPQNVKTFTAEAQKAQRKEGSRVFSGPKLHLTNGDVMVSGYY